MSDVSGDRNVKQVIFKYVIELIERQVIAMPEGAQVRSVQMQHGQIVMWAQVDPDVPKEDRTFAVVGTGHVEIDPDGMEYVESVQDGSFVWHIFEVSPSVTQETNE
jgi:hypothetical protein